MPCSPRQNNHEHSATGTDLLTLMMASLIISVPDESASERDPNDTYTTARRRVWVLDHTRVVSHLCMKRGWWRPCQRQHRQLSLETSRREESGQRLLVVEEAKDASDGLLRPVFGDDNGCCYGRRKRAKRRKEGERGAASGAWAAFLYLFRRAGGKVDLPASPCLPLLLFSFCSIPLCCVLLRL